MEVLPNPGYFESLGAEIAARFVKSTMGELGNYITIMEQLLARQ